MLGIYFVIKTFLKLYVIVVIIIFTAVDLLGVRLLSVLRGHLVFFSIPATNGQWTPTLKDFHPIFYPLAFSCHILVPEEEPEFPFK